MFTYFILIVILLRFLAKIYIHLPFFNPNHLLLLFLYLIAKQSRDLEIVDNSKVYFVLFAYSILTILFVIFMANSKVYLFFR